MSNEYTLRKVRALLPLVSVVSALTTTILFYQEHPEYRGGKAPYAYADFSQDQWGLAEWATVSYLSTAVFSILFGIPFLRNMMSSRQGQSV